MSEEKKAFELKDEELSIVSGGTTTGNPLYSVGQHICISSSLIVEITSVVQVDH